MNVLDSATRLAARTFLTAVPLVSLVASFAPQGLREQSAESVHALFGLSGGAETELPT